MKPVSSLALSFLAFASTVYAEEWPGWRGPRGDGTSTETKVPLAWSKTENVAWKVEIPGIGHSSPAIWGDHVFVTTCLPKEEKRVLLCVDRRGGKILWQRDVLSSPLEPKHKLNSFASSTPTTDGRHVYTSFLQLRPKNDKDAEGKSRAAKLYPADRVPEIVVTCWSVKGDRVWEKTVGRFYSPHGFCSTPLLYKDLVIINGDQDAQGYLVALDQSTGAERWRTLRPNLTRWCCAPLIVDAGGKKQMVLTGSMCVASYDPDTGKELWLVKGPTEQFVASPVYTEGTFFITAGFPERHNMAIQPDGKVLWHEAKVNRRMASYVPSPIAYGAYFYVVSDDGYLSCFEAKTGKRIYMEQLGRHHSASPIEAQGRLYFVDDDGTTFVVKAGPKFEVVARNEIGTTCYGSPALAHGQLFLRTASHLVCIGTPAPAASARSGK